MATDPRAINTAHSWSATTRGVADSATGIPRTSLCLAVSRTSADLTEASRSALAALIRSDWGMASAALAGRLMGGTTPDERARFNRDQVKFANAELLARGFEARPDLDLRAELSLIAAPTVVLHRRDDTIVPLEAAREIAAGIAGARLVLLNGEAHFPQHGDVEEFLRALEGFLDEPVARASRTQPPAARRSSARRPAPPKGRSAFRTILFTDVVASTPLLAQLRDARMREVMRAHDEVLTAAVTAHGGRVVKTIGDAFMAEFAAPSNALQAAIEAQRGIREKFAASDVPIRVRIGINVGEPIEEDGDLHGAAVVIAKRLEGEAVGGGIVVSDAVKQSLAGKEFDFDDLGPLPLKGFAEPIRAWTVRWE